MRKNFYDRTPGRSVYSDDLFTSHRTTGRAGGLIIGAARCSTISIIGIGIDIAIDPDSDIDSDTDSECACLLYDDKNLML